MTETIINSEPTIPLGKAIPKVCPRCHKGVEVVSVKEGLCVECLSAIQKIKDNRFALAVEGFEKMIEKYGHKKIKCVNQTCNKVATIKEADESGWSKKGPFLLCDECSKDGNINLQYTFRM